MNIEQMRKDISDVYPGPKWRERCARMPDAQVIAIYRSFQRTCKFDPEFKELLDRRKKESDTKQLDIFDVWGKEVVNG